MTATAPGRCWWPGCSQWVRHDLAGLGYHPCHLLRRLCRRAGCVSHRAPIRAATVASRWFIRMRGAGHRRHIPLRSHRWGSVHHAGGGGDRQPRSGGCLDFPRRCHAGRSVAADLLLVAERPENLGLMPDGEARGRPHPNLSQGRGDINAGQGGDSWTALEATRTMSFWILVVMGFATFFVHAGVNVHIGAYLRDQGLFAYQCGIGGDRQAGSYRQWAASVGLAYGASSGRLMVFRDDGPAVRGCAAAVPGQQHPWALSPLPSLSVWWPPGVTSPLRWYTLITMAGRPLVKSGASAK